tara:strand:- start:550 stop:960 length:411 start_codon:yes stop_codon:yes gene_type:complete
MIKTKPQDSRYNIHYGKKVFVYRNLHKGCWSIKQGGLVKAHSTEEPILLYETSLKVSRKGREKVLREKRKNVHAGIHGYLKPPIPQYNTYTDGHVDFMKVTYNPYKYRSFVDSDTDKPVYFSPFVRMESKQVLAAK